MRLFFSFFFFLVITDNSFKFHKVIDYRVKKFSLSIDIKWHWDSLFLLKIFKKNCWPKTILDSLHSSTWWWTGLEKKRWRLETICWMITLQRWRWGYLAWWRFSSCSIPFGVILACQETTAEEFFLRIHKTFLFFKISRKMKQLASVWKWISWNLKKFQLIQLIQKIFVSIFCIHCLIGLKFCHKILFSNRYWKFQFSILKNKKVLYIKKKIKLLSISKQKSFVYCLNFPEGFG